MASTYYTPIGMGEKFKASQPQYPNDWNWYAQVLSIGVKSILRDGYKGLADYYDAAGLPDEARRARDAAELAVKTDQQRYEQMTAESQFGYTQR